MRPRARMLCASCGHVGIPDTWVPGSDRLELAAWCGLGVPGLVYCGWRHLHRTKRCADCGGGVLVREARASRRPRAVDPGVARVYSAGGPPWPRALVTPRQRLRHGAALAAFGGLALLDAGAGWLAAAPADAPGALGQASALLGMSWVFVQIALFHRTPSPWHAWDDGGRAVDVETL